jgi:hypothetical protein
LKSESNKTLEQEKIENVAKKYTVIDKIKDQGLRDCLLA